MYSVLSLFSIIVGECYDYVTSPSAHVLTRGFPARCSLSFIHSLSGIGYDKDLLINQVEVVKN